MRAGRRDLAITDIIRYSCSTPGEYWLLVSSEDIATDLRERLIARLDWLEIAHEQVGLKIKISNGAIISVKAMDKEKPAIT